MRRRIALAAVALVVLGACGTDAGEPVDIATLLEGRQGSSTAAEGELGTTWAAGGGAGSHRGSAGDLSTGRTRTSSGAGTGPGGVHTVPGVPADAGRVEVGVRYLDGADQLATQLGAQGFSVPDTRAMAQALIDEVNRTGGLAGHEIVPVWHPYNASDPAGTATQEQEACTFFTEDHHVSAVLSPVFSSDVLQGCLAERGVILVDENYGFFDMSIAPETYFVPGYPDPVRSAGALVDDLVAQGFFGSQPRVGITMKDSPDRQRVANGIKAALARHGIVVADEMRYTADHPDAMLSGVLRFRANDVTHVFILDVGGLESGVIMQAAEAQAYRPAYALDSRNSLDYLQKNVPPAQLSRSRGLGWFPASDVGRGPGSEAGALEERCGGIMRAAGIELRDAGNDRFAYAVCDVFLLLEAGADAGADVTPAAIRAGIESLGPYQPTGSFASRFRPGVHDGTAAAKRIAFDDPCACFRYTSDLVDIG